MDSAFLAFDTLLKVESLANYQSVLQLGVGLNVVLSGYSELRQKLESEIEEKTSLAEDRIKQIMCHRKEQLSLDSKNQRSRDKLERAQKYKDKLSEFNSDYYGARTIWRRKDQLFLSLLLCSASLCLLFLLASSSSSLAIKAPAVLLLALSCLLYCPAVGAIVRALWLSGSVRRGYRAKAMYVTGQVTKMYNADFRQFNSAGIEPNQH